MVRLRPYKKCDAATIVGWLTDEAGFWKWCAGRYDHYPITAEDMNAFYNQFERNPRHFHDDAGWNRSKGASHHAVPR